MKDPRSTIPFRDQFVLDCLVEWEQQYQQGQDITPEELCSTQTDYLEQVREAIYRRKRILALITPGEHVEALPELPGITLQAMIGHGGMGTVYRGVQNELGRPVAVKMLNNMRLDPSALARFRGEALALAKLQHPNIVHIYDVGESGPHAYILLELLDTNLARILQDAPLSPRVAARVVQTLANAVHHAHEQGILHRDLKPGNVLIRKDDTDQTELGMHLKIADFGLAKTLDRSEVDNKTVTGAILGTPSYMAPEQASGSKEISPVTDVYALGAILYECLTARAPFRGTDLFDTLHQVQTRDPVPPRQLQPGIPRDLEVICLKCLEKSPHKRYASARALAEDIERFLHNHTIHARPAPAYQRAFKWTRRNPTLAASIVLGCAFLAIIFGITWRYNSHILDQSTQLRKQRDQLQAEKDLRHNASRTTVRLVQAQEKLIDTYRIPTPPEVDRALVEAIRSFQMFLQADAEEVEGFEELGRMATVRAKVTASEELTQVAIAALEKAVALRAQLLAGEPDNPKARAALAHAYHNLGDIRAAHRDKEEAVAALQHARDHWKLLVADHPDQPQWRIAAANTEATWGRFQHHIFQNYQESLHASEAALAVLEPTDLSTRFSPAARSQTAYILSTCAEASHKLGDYPKAIQYWDRALQPGRLPEPLRYQYRYGLALVLADHGDHQWLATELQQLARAKHYNAKEDASELAWLFARAYDLARSQETGEIDRDALLAQSLKYLQEAVNVKAITRAQLQDPKWKPLHASTEWNALVRQLDE